MECGKPKESGFLTKKSESSAKNVQEHYQYGDAKGLLTTTPVSCATQNHIGYRGDLFSTL